MERYLIITGASSGLGEVFADRFARAKNNLVLVARREEKLAALKQKLEREHGVSVEVLPADLSQADAAPVLFEEVQRRGIEIHGVVNNAGFGWNGTFSDQEMASLESLINVNLVSLTKLTRLFLPAMITRNEGLILNVSSTGAFQPVPHFAVYAALKAYVYSFTLALAEELKKTKVRVFCLCPGATRTGFQEAAGQTNPKSVGGWQTSEEVVDFAMRRLRGRKSFGIPGLNNRFAAFMNRLVPAKVATRISGRLMRPEER